MTNYLRNTEHTGDTITRAEWDRLAADDRDYARHNTATDTQADSGEPFRTGDGCGLNATSIRTNYHAVTIVEPEPVAAPLADWERELMGEPATDAETPVEAPLAPVDPLEAWQAGLPDAEAVRAAMWEAADNAADNAGACSEYEQTAAWPHGHEGREQHRGMVDEYGEAMGAGTVTYRRDVYRTVRVTQELVIDVEAGEDAWSAMRESYDWEDIDEDVLEDQEADDGPETYDINREALPALGEPTPPAALVRAALDAGNDWRQIKDALLGAARAAGAPILNTPTIDLAVDVSRWDAEAGAWQAPTREAHRRLAATDWQARTIEENATSADAYNVARELLRGVRPEEITPRLAFPTLAAVVRREWSVTA
jgi:hypothetical protein